MASSEKTDWKKEARHLQSPKPVTGDLPEIVWWDDTGKELLKRGNRSSVGNEGTGAGVDRLLAVMGINLKDRIKDVKKKHPPTIDIRTRQQKLKGLFGGGK